MIRLTKISVFAFLSVAAANAGNIEIGGVNGLTSSYISSGCAGTTCVAGSAGSFVEGNYDYKLFQTGTTTTFTPYTGYSGSAGETGTLGTSPQFSMINDGIGSNGSNNIWYAGGTTAIQVPIGLNAINSVSMMLNDIWGVAGAQDTVVTFDFANSSNGSTVDQVIVDLTNSGAGGSSASGQIQSSVDCSSPCSYNSNTFASGPTLASSTPTATLNGVGTTGVTVTTQDLYTAAYTNSNIMSTSAYVNTSGSINLDALTFTFPAAITSNLYLTEITVADPNIAAKVSETALSAITVNTAAPEPSTVTLLFAGLGLLAYAGYRRKSAGSL